MNASEERSDATEPKRASGEVCQLMWHDAALEPLNPVEHFLRTAKRRTRGVLRRLGLLPTHRLDSRHAPPWRRPPALPSWDGAARGGGGSARSAEGRSEGTGNDRAGKQRGRPSGGHLKAGDLVRVKSLEEIVETLDEHRKYRGLQFLHPMAEHCGKTYRVFKRVRRLVNDMDHTVRKAKNVVILEGVFCHGRGIYGREDCDRTCFFFWKEEWLTKLDGPKDQDA